MRDQFRLDHQCEQGCAVRLTVWFDQRLEAANLTGLDPCLTGFVSSYCPRTILIAVQAFVRSNRDKMKRV